MTLYKSPLRLIPGWRGPRESTAALQTYADKILGYNPTVLFPHAEAPAVPLPPSDELVNGWDGAYTGVTLADSTGPDGQPVPRFDGVNDFNDTFTAALQGAFNGQVGSIWICVRVFAGGWTDGTTRNMFHLYADGQNGVRIIKHVANGRMQWLYEANTILETVTKNAVAEYGWLGLGLTYDLNAGVNGEMKAYYYTLADGVGGQEGATQVALGVFAGALHFQFTSVGCFSIVGPTNPWNGWIGPFAYWAGTVLSLADYDDLAVV